MNPILRVFYGELRDLQGKSGENAHSCSRNKARSSLEMLPDSLNSTSRTQHLPGAGMEWGSWQRVGWAGAAEMKGRGSDSLQDLGHPGRSKSPKNGRGQHSKVC